MIVRFVDIGGIVGHHCLSLIVLKICFFKIILCTQTKTKWMVFMRHHLLFRYTCIMLCDGGGGGIVAGKKTQLVKYVY